MYYYSRKDSGELNGHYQEWSYEWQLKWHNCDITTLHKCNINFIHLIFILQKPPFLCLWSKFQTKWLLDSMWLWTQLVINCSDNYFRYLQFYISVYNYLFIVIIYTTQGSLTPEVYLGSKMIPINVAVLKWNEAFWTNIISGMSFCTALAVEKVGMLCTHWAQGSSEANKQRRLCDDAWACQRAPGTEYRPTVWGQMEPELLYPSQAGYRIYTVNLAYVHSLRHSNTR